MLLLVAGQMPAYGQQAWHWKKYVYERDGFAVTLPQAPNPHTDPNLPSATVYSIHLSAESALSIRALPDPRPCTDTLGQLKSGALGGKQPWYFRLKGGRPFAIAGLWDRGSNPMASKRKLSRIRLQHACA